MAYCWQFMTLESGGIITTGTPPGVGLGQKPQPWYLQAGDVVTLGVETLGNAAAESCRMGRSVTRLGGVGASKRCF
jgi:2-keto-4-pentenoate hydratase/2-oxohepta-3-ene-1,7-dioic acid hydratase in catechol pathway